MALFDKLKAVPTEGQRIGFKILNNKKRNEQINLLLESIKKLNWDNKKEVNEFLTVNIKDIIRLMPHSDKLLYYFGRPDISGTLLELLKNKEFYLSKEEKQAFNEVAYLYLVCGENGIDNETYTLVSSNCIAISHIINSEEYLGLRFITNFDQKTIDMIVLARNTATSLDIIIARVILIICLQCDPNKYEDLDVLELFRALFYNDDIGQVFLVGMFNVRNERDDEWYTHRMSFMDSWITNAIIYLLNDLPLNQIKNILKTYSEECLRKNCTYKDVRCSLLTLSMDYEKVSFVANMLKEEGYYII